MDKAAEIAIKEAHHRLNNPHLYLGHGLSLQEGLWKRRSPMNNIQRELVDYIKGHPIINTHSHHLQDHIYKAFNLDSVLRQSYVNWNQVPLEVHMKVG